VLKVSFSEGRFSDYKIHKLYTCEEYITAFEAANRHVPEVFYHYDYCGALVTGGNGTNPFILTRDTTLLTESDSINF